MAKEKQYQNFIDQFLEDTMPDYEAVGLGEAKDSGEEQLDRTHQYIDEDFMDEIANGHSAHTPVPAGSRTGSAERELRSRRAAKALDDDSMFNEVTMELEAAKNHGQVEKRKVSEPEIQAYVRRLLNDGMPPVKIAAQLNKMAELLLFNKGMATDYLNRNAGQLGLAYIQPNEFMDRCPDTYQRLKVKGAGKIAAKSVKQINACSNCQFFNKNASSKTCNLYHLPIIATQNELLTIVNKMTAGVPAASKKAALVKIANREPERTPVVNHVVSSRPTQKIHNTSPDMARQASQKKEAKFDAEDFAKYHKAGNSLERIYNFAVKKVVSAAAARSVREFVASLKTRNTKIALSQIDCTFLKAKLGVHNAIVGASKCGSCTYRQGMHCGFTGGTLVSFPGMDKQASNHKIAADAPKDGRAMLQEYDSTSAAPMEDIEISSGPERLKVQMSSTMTSGDLE